MRNSYLQKVIPKMQKKKGKIIYAEEIKQIISQVMKEAYTDTKAYKIIYYMKNKGYLISIKKDIFYCKLPEDHLSEFLILEDRYRHILHRHCTSGLDKKRYIGGLKALELQVQNFEIPDTILIVNPEKQSKEMVVATKAVQFKKYTLKKEDLFTKFQKFTIKMKMGKYSFAVANKELALLECMYNYDDMYDKETYVAVRKVIRRSTQLDIDVITKIIKLGKHHTSVNRLYKIAKDVNKTFATKLAEVIKKYSFFLDV